MAGWNLLLFVVLGGYFFLRLDPRSAINANRMRRDRLLFQSVGVGILFGVASFVIIHLLLAPLCPPLVQIWNGWFPVRHSGTAAGTLVLGALFGFIFRGLCKSDEYWDARYPKLAMGYQWLRRECPSLARRWDVFRSWFRRVWLDDYLRRWVHQQGSNLEKLLLKCGDRGMPVQVALDNRKVYIGEIDYFPAEFEEAGTHLELRLYASGYRDDDSLSLVVTNRYIELSTDVLFRMGRLASIRDKLTERKESISAKRWITQRHTDCRLKAVAKRYTELYGYLEELRHNLVVTIPFDRIVTAMPFDGYIYECMDGTSEAVPGHPY